MLRLAPTVCDVPSALNLSIGRWRLFSTKAKQCLKSGHRIPPTIVPKHELIQVDLKLRVTDPMVGCGSPKHVRTIFVEQTVRTRDGRETEAAPKQPFGTMRPSRASTRIVRVSDAESYAQDQAARRSYR